VSAHPDDAGLVSVVEVLEQLGGVATRAELIRCCDRQSFDQAVAAGDVTSIGRGAYALAVADEVLVAAHRVGGVASHRSAALRHGWAVLHVPKLPEVTVPKDRRVTDEQRRGVSLHWADVDRLDRATSPSRTLLDCLRTLPALEALAVADSALRSGFSRRELLAIGREARGPGSRQAREIAQMATRLAANPFESGLRGIAARVGGLAVRPQVSVYDPHFLGRPDLVDERLRMVLEADSFEWHGGRGALAADARRYNALVAHGWLVLRFCWEDVMFCADEVERTLRAAVELRTDQLCVSCRAV
jgi:very-short-patch-repair endonuclease